MSGLAHVWNRDWKSWLHETVSGKVVLRVQSVTEMSVAIAVLTLGRSYRLGYFTENEI